MIRTYRLELEFDVQVGTKMEEVEQWGCGTAILNAPKEWNDMPMDHVEGCLHVLIDHWLNEWAKKHDDPKTMPLVMPIRVRMLSPKE